ncbi:hypothetical protein [Actinomadura miaoliensis]
MTDHTIGICEPQSTAWGREVEGLGQEGKEHLPGLKASGARAYAKAHGE